MRRIILLCLLFLAGVMFPVFSNENEVDTTNKVIVESLEDFSVDNNCNTVIVAGFLYSFVFIFQTDTNKPQQVSLRYKLFEYCTKRVFFILYGKILCIHKGCARKNADGDNVFCSSNCRAFKFCNQVS